MHILVPKHSLYALADSPLLIGFIPLSSTHFEYEERQSHFVLQPTGHSVSHLTPNSHPSYQRILTNAPPYFALAYFVPPAFENIRWKVYIVFGVFCVSMFIHVFFLFPETAQKPLEEVEEIFADDTPGSIKYLGTPAWETHVDTHTRRLERGEMDAEEKFGRRISQEEAPARVSEATKVN